MVKEEIVSLLASWCGYDDPSEASTGELLGFNEDADQLLQIYIKHIEKIFEEIEGQYFPDPRIGIKEEIMNFNITPSFWQSLKDKYLKDKEVKK